MPSEPTQSPSGAAHCDRGVPRARLGLATLCLTALLAGCVAPSDRPSQPPPAPASPLARAAWDFVHRADYVPLVESRGAAPRGARVTPPPARPKPAPPVAHPNLLQLHPPLSVQPLESVGSSGHPLLYVPLDVVAGYYATACRPAYLGLYRQDVKVGWERHTCAVDLAARPPRFTRTVQGLRRQRALGPAHMLRYEETRTWALSPPGALISAVRVERRGAAVRTRTLRREQGAWVWRQRRQRPGAPPREERRTLIDVHLAAPSSDLAIRPALVTGALPLGRPRRVYRLDLRTGRTDMWLVQLQATESRRLRGVRVRLRSLSWLRLRDEAQWETTYDAAGSPLLTVPEEDGLRRVAERATTYRRGVGRRPLFALGVFFPAPNEDLAEQEEIDALEAVLRGPDLTRFQRPPGQRLTPKGPGRAVLEVFTAPWKKTPPAQPLYRLPVQDPRRAAWLADRPDLRITDPLLVQTARAQIQGQRNALRAAVVLGRFVHRRLRKRLTWRSLPAPALLRAGAGDSADHARLLVALCRAVGVPAQAVGGLVWEPSLESFVVDTWVEVAAGPDVVVPLDPARKQFPAQATHIALGPPEAIAWQAAVSRVTVALPQEDPPSEPDPAPSPAPDGGGAAGARKHADAPGAAGSAHAAAPSRQ